MNIERFKTKMALFRTHFFRFLLFNLVMRYYWLEWMLPFHVVNLVLGASTWIFFGKSFERAPHRGPTRSTPSSLPTTPTDICDENSEAGAPTRPRAKRPMARLRSLNTLRLNPVPPRSISIQILHRPRTCQDTSRINPYKQASAPNTT